MGFGQDRGEESMDLTSHPERQSECAQYSSRNAGNGHQDHTVVIMDYDVDDHGRFNPGRRRENQERRRRHTAPLQKKNFQTTKKPPAETYVTSSTSCRGITWNRDESGAALLRVYYCAPCEMQSSIYSGNSLPLLEMQGC
jgi:hypothetical protein